MAFNLLDFEKSYENLAKKYKLPSFEEMNADFEIDKIDKETDLVLRQVRKTMMDKVVNSMQFLDMLLNPVNAPRMYLVFTQTMAQSDREIIDRMYGRFASLIVLSLDLEVDWSERGEADLILNIAKSWKETKPDFKKLLDRIKKPASFAKRERLYSG